MKFGSPRVYNPWQSEELHSLTVISNGLMDQIDYHVKYANRLVAENRIVTAQLRDCYLTVPEQIARLDALNEMEFPQ